MASPVSTLTLCCSSSVISGKLFMYAPSSSSFCLQSEQPSRRFCLPKQSLQLGRCYFASWSGLRNMSISISVKSLKTGKKGRGKGMTVRASLFGVGAPEALVIGVVALLVFGPKGLAEVARNLGKTLRAFQPTIRELQDVSREFKNTLEREIGLDDIPNSSQSAYGSRRADSISRPNTFGSENPQTVTDTNGVPPNRAYSSEEYLKITEEQLKASVPLQGKMSNSPEEKQSETEDHSQASAQESAGETLLPPKPESGT